MPPNIWALSKDVAIKHLLLILTERLGPEGFVLPVPDPDPADAVRLLSPCDPRLTAYLYTYGQEEGRYGLHLEYPPGEGGLTLREAREGVEFDRALEWLVVHLRVDGD
ncbi:MAG: hypothetical protein COX57_11605 [Alphaproteobacteria bacterium CG_4_10_14_0_2_um_filter_63_37]|nr:MAG: hypothetical protein AUJ55_06155 [Proteobacteria bacterium CG1_02_64_396]PJA23843.1 MAG: hypothetical protein COX57_11605 [Alphaproteobacteria bacterium CG_4_10_14_0_2_um_filter_63_37]